MNIDEQSLGRVQAQIRSLLASRVLAGRDPATGLDVTVRMPTWLWNPAFLAGDRVVRGAMADPAQQAREDRVCGAECLGPEP